LNKTAGAPVCGCCWRCSRWLLRRAVARRAPTLRPFACSTYDAAKVTHAYLENALESLVAGKAIAAPKTKSVGCTIKFRPNPNAAK
jgi:hypothetical protein